MNELGPDEGINRLQHPDCRACRERERLNLGIMEENRQLKVDLDVLRESILGKAGGKVIAGALRTCIDSHGPIEARHIGSAEKRIRSQLRVRYEEWAKKRKAKGEQQ
jgi:hypothetical protein